MKDEIIMKDGKLHKIAQVVMLPTEKASKIHKNDETLDLIFYKEETEKKFLTHQDYMSIPHELYILSDEEIKEDDLPCWSINKNRDTVYQVQTLEGSVNWKKIIGTTDESLRIYKEDIVCDKGYYISLPRPSDDFLKAYVKARGNITEVLIEYEYVQDEGWNDNSGAYDMSYYKLKVAKDNTITIKPVINVYVSEKAIPFVTEALGFNPFKTELQLKPEHIELLETGSKYFFEDRTEYVLDQKFTNKDGKWFVEVLEKTYSKEELEKLLIKHQSDYRSHVRKTNGWSMDIVNWINQNL